MRSGKLRQRIQIWDFTEVQDTHNQKVKVWGLNAIIWGEIVPIQGSERFNLTDQVNSDLTHKVRLRWSRARRTLSTSMRLVRRDMILEIVSIINSDIRDTEIIVMCKELTGKKYQDVLYNADHDVVYNPDGMTILVGA